MLDAETIGGQNYALWNNLITQQVSLWELDSNWAFQKQTIAAYGSDEFLQLEAVFNNDLDANGAKAQLKNGQIDKEAKTTIESSGNLTTKYSLDSVVYVSDKSNNEIVLSSRAVK